MYVVYLLDWLSVFSRDQILVLQTEQYSAHIKEKMDKVFDFLDLGMYKINPSEIFTIFITKVEIYMLFSHRAVYERSLVLSPA